MPTGFKAKALAGALFLLTAFAHAQAPTPLPTHAVRSISPTDVDFRDLEFLKAEIGPARVVMLGEPTHGEGNVFEAKIRLLRFLREQMGFTTVVFESGFYDLHKAQQALEAGRPAQEAIGSSVFNIWTGAQEFQAILPLLGPDGLRVAGFDPQLSNDYGADQVDDLREFLAPQKGAGQVNYDYLEEVVSYMGEHFEMLPEARPADFEKEMDKVSRLLDKIAAGSPGKRADEARFWQQNGRSLVAQLRDYATKSKQQLDENSFKAIDSNPRDAQMADNLLWYLRQHPQEKVVCWAALPHLANQLENFRNAEIQVYRPMGRAVKTALGAGQVYILGTLGGGGSYGSWPEAGRPVPAPAAGSLEAELLAQPADYAFVSLKHDAPGRELTTYAFEYKPLAGPWSEAVDGFLFVRAVQPAHPASLMVAAGPTADTAAAKARPTANALNPGRVLRQVRTATAGTAVRGVVLDQKTKAPVPYASVSVPASGVGTVADGQGRFGLMVPADAQLVVSSVGYATATVPAAAGGLTVRLQPSAYELAGVQVRGESLDPRKIMKKVLAALPRNYETGHYSAEVYTQRQTTNYDTLAYETESVSQFFVPAGYHHWAGGFLMLGAVPQHLTKEVHLTKAFPKSQQLFSEQSGQGFNAASADPVRTSPLFNASTLRKFQLHLDSVVERAGQTVYLISFVAKHANHRSTGTYLTSEYSGRLYVQQRDYAVTRYEALWQADTAYINRATRQWYGRPNIRARLYPNLLATDRTDHVVEYLPGANGRYHVRRSVGRNLSVGRTLGGPAFYRQSSCTEYFTGLPLDTPPILSKAEMTLGDVHKETAALPKPVYHPEFWNTYQRPVK
ncbi:erythromycin esterase family protein [Hymenobacter sp. DH14]|uniref:Erythromycin esterase family protein n=1 Tax=Hymenobacter cyanobacteriorum TaxID=2926463 RepID=A0A9X1VL23_9BACT|nr:erythromycin esterase family protein [Hymenobacter cyanobacteriorum]MCI1190142.1 erythromycin esterase family protein [Hymenobacter cyanobacteriorum]